LPRVLPTFLALAALPPDLGERWVRLARVREVRWRGLEALVAVCRRMGAIDHFLLLCSSPSSTDDDGMARG
jgi:hypothetical protein